MDAPVFPQEFVEKHCWHVSEAKDWRRNLNLPPDPQEDIMYADCEFRPAGFGMECASCKKFLSGVHMTAEEEKFLPLIRKYYKDSNDYWKEKDRLREENERISMMDMGAGI